MTLVVGQLAQTPARVGVMRVGAFRIGYAPSSTRSTAVGSISGGLTFWQSLQPPTTVWTVIKAA